MKMAELTQSAEDVRLRIGLLVDDLVQPNWVCKIIGDINQSRIAKLVLVISRRTRPPFRPWFKNILARRPHLMWSLYQKVDRRFFGYTPSALETSDISPLLANCRECSIEFGEERGKHLGEDMVRPDTNSPNLDVVLCFGTTMPEGRLPMKTRYGIWFYRAGDNTEYRGEPPCFSETFDNNPTMSLRLEALDVESGQTTTLAQCWRAVDSVSVARNQNELYWGAARMTGGVLSQLYSEGLAAYQERPQRKGYRLYSGPQYEPPANRKMVAFLGSLARRVAGRQLINRLYEGQWCLAYKMASSHCDGLHLYDAKCLIPPKDRFWADPFPIKQGGGYFVFIEEYLYRRRKAHISVIEMDAQGVCKSPVKVLEKPYHLSYPFVFKWDGAYYMIPETQDAEEIQLYKCVAFPRRWELERVLVQGVSAVDTTLLLQGGKWWMFTSLKNGEEINNTSNLCLFLADCPLGPWHEHTKNPVVSDARCGRSAGRLFSVDGALYRPAQDCSQSYGRAISMRRITRLDCSHYREEEINRIEPSWRNDLIGTHTYNRAGNLTMVDFFRLKSRWSRRVSELLAVVPLGKSGLAVLKPSGDAFPGIT